MSVTELLSKLRQRDIRLRPEGSRLHLDAPEGALTPSLRDSIAAHKAELLRLLNREGEGAERPEPIRVSRDSTPRPASFSQQRLWFLDQLDPGTSVYNMSRAMRLKGRFSAEAAQKSLEALVARHETLRTTFLSVDGVPMQAIAASAPASLPLTDLSDKPAEPREASLDALVREEAGRPFDLARGPLFRSVLYRLGEDDHLLQLSMHHIVSDGWSLVVLFRELAALYTAFRAGEPASLPELPVQYADYAEWQRERLQGQTLERELSYWRRQLARIETLNLPTDRPRPAIQTFAGGTQSCRIPPEVAARLKDLATREGATLFMALLAAFQLLLSRLSGQQDVVVGSPIAGRNRSELEHLVGFFMNTLVLRTDLSGEPSFLELLSRVRRTALEAYEHQEVPFEKLVEELRPERDQSRNPLFQVLINMLNFGDDRRIELPSLDVSFQQRFESPSKFDLTLYAREEAEAIRLTLSYNADLFDEGRMAELLEQYSALVQQIVDRPRERVSAYTLVTESARILLPDPAARLRGQPAGLIHAPPSVQRGDGGTAVVDRHGAWTYRDLEDRGCRLAHRLRRCGIGRDDTVAVYGHRSAPFVAAILGVLKSGAAFVVLDPAHPAGRLIDCLRQADPKGWIEIGDAGAPDPELERYLAARPWAWRLRLSRRCEELDGETDQGPLPVVDPHDLAYVAFTSGTTGGVKGILGTHAPVAHFLDWHVRTFGLSAADRFSLLSGLSHDPLLRDVFTPLRLGATLCIPDPERLVEPGYLADWMLREHISVAHLTPALAQVLCEGSEGIALDSLRYAFFGGDVLTRSAVLRLKRAAPSVTCVNFYGATETPQAMSYLEVTTSELDRPGQEELALGRGIEGAQLLVLNIAGGQAGVAELGEICVRTPYLSRGYLGDEGLTRERFVANPFGDAPEDLLYRTGDRGRYLPDGGVEFCGRRDSQVKVRGFRVELGEIEAAILALPGIAQVAVILREDAPGDPRLVAYVVGSDPEPPSAATLRSRLQGSLPDYMLPSAFVFLDTLPLTPNGKLDRRALPAPGRRPEASADQAPRTPTEEILADIWVEVLGVSRVAVHDSFFELGGHSLLATQMVARARQALGVDLPLRALFEAPTLAALAARVEAERAAHEALEVLPIPVASRGGELPLSFAQQRLWLLEQIEPGSAAYHLAGAVEMRGQLDVEALRRALQMIVRRHESLRTRLPAEGGTPRQVVAGGLTGELPVVDVGGGHPRLARLMKAELQRPFDLAQGPLYRTVLYRLEHDVHVLQLTCHHVVFDGWSMGVFVRELTALYGEFAGGAGAELPPLPVQYADYACWQRQRLAGEVLERQLDYWRGRLAGAPRALELPTDHPRPAIETHRGARQAFVIPDGLARRLMELSRAEGATLFMTLLAAFSVLLSRYSGQRDLVLGTPIAGRSRPELEGLIGFFVNTLVLRMDVSGQPSFRELLLRVKETALEAYAHQDVPFERLVEELRPERDLGRNPLFQVMFVLQNAPRQDLALPGLRVTPLEIERNAAQFDVSLHLRPRPEGLVGFFEYATDLFEAGTIERMAGHFVRLLTGVVTDPACRITELPLLTEGELSRLAEWNATAQSYPAVCVQDLIWERGCQVSERVAVECGGRRLSYGELLERAEALARHLRGLGVGPGERVGIYLERSLELVVSVLGVLRAGGAYVPLDPGYPRERLEYMVEDSGLRVLLSQRELAGSEPRGAGAVLYVDGEWGEAGHGPVGWREAEGEDLAYVIYTSGSTGKPKGVAVRHRSLVNLLTSMGREPGLSGEDVLLSVTTLSFDIAGLELYLPLLQGGRVALATRDEASDGVRLRELLLGSGATVMQATPATWRLLLEAGWNGASGLKVLCGGEALTRDLADELVARAGEVWNVYGPTETTIWSSACRVGRGEAVSIGRPIGNTRMYVLDEALRPLPVGVPGELYIGGDGLAQGYWGRPELTGERFVPDPLGGGDRLYRTGDVARWLADGRLECLGRVDHQVKVRGFRIELGEIEAALAEHPGVKQSVVVAQPGTGGERQLVAYLAHGTAPQPSVTELRAQLKRRLPVYMVPSSFVFLDKLPLTPNGKLDRKALAGLDAAHGHAREAFVPPHTPMEVFIADLWKQALGVERVGRRDNFFDLGGHSLLAMQVLAPIERKIGRRVNPREIIFQTLEQLAASCEAAAATGAGRSQGLRSRLIEAIRSVVPGAQPEAEPES